MDRLRESEIVTETGTERETESAKEIDRYTLTD